MIKKKREGKPKKSTPMSEMLAGMIEGIEPAAPQNDIPVEYFKIIFDKFYNYFYENGEGSHNEPVFKKITEVFGIKTEFEEDLDYPYSKKDKSEERYRIIVLPDVGTKAEKEQRAFDMIKEFEGLEARGLYQLFLTMMNSYLHHPSNLINFIKKCDPNPTKEMAGTYKNMFIWLSEKKSQSGEDISS